VQEYEQYDAVALAQLVRDRQVSPRELVDAAIDRIERRNPGLNAVVHRMYDRARRTAEAPLPDGPFRGVPFLLKDLLCWYEGEPTTCGSRLFRNWIAPHDTEMVRRYRAAGLIVVGKTNTPEFGLVPFTESELLGICRNPWRATHTVAGSSGGSAAAVASGMVPMAGGGDGGGSIRMPASCCGLFGLKPTRGRTPTGPDQGELWRGAVVEHAITRTVRDSAALLDAIAGPDVGAPYYASPPVRPFLAEAATPPSPLRIAFTTDPLLGREVHPGCRDAVLATARLLESLGHHVEEATPPLDRDAFSRAFLTVICVETRAELDDAEVMLGKRVTRHDVELPTWVISLIGSAITGPEYADAVRLLQRHARRVGAFFEEYPVLVTPTVASPPFPHRALQPTAGERQQLAALGLFSSGRLVRAVGALERAATKVFDWMAYTPLANATGQPAMSVPLAWSGDGLPIGVHFMGRYGDEATLFRLAGQLEAAAPWNHRRPATGA
jgi:amidase